MPPARGTIQILFAYAKAIDVALTVGDRRSRVGPFGDGAAERETTASAAMMSARCLRATENLPEETGEILRLPWSDRKGPWNVIAVASVFRRTSERYNRPMHHVYVVRCADGTLYTGYARDPTARVKVHNAGRGAKYTAGRRPVMLVYSETFDTRSAALRREHELKRWRRLAKETLIGNPRRKHDATKSRG